MTFAPRGYTGGFPKRLARRLRYPMICVIYRDMCSHGVQHIGMLDMQVG